MSITKFPFLVVALAMLPSLLAAQQPAPPAGRPGVPAALGQASPHTVTFVLVESLGVDTAGAVVLRRAARGPQNVILVTRATTPADLVNALTMLNRSRRSKGDALTLDMRAVIPRGNDAAARRSRNYEVAVTNLERLRVVNARPVDGVGTFPAVTVTLSRARPR